MRWQDLSTVERAITACRTRLGNTNYRYRISLLSPLERQILSAIELRMDPQDVIDEIAITLNGSANQRHISEQTLKKAQRIWVACVQNIARALLATHPPHH